MCTSWEDCYTRLICNGNVHTYVLFYKHGAYMHTLSLLQSTVLVEQWKIAFAYCILE